MNVNAKGVFLGMKHAIPAAPSPRASIVQKNLERRQVPQVLVRPSQMGLNDAVELGKQTRSADGLFPAGHQQVQTAAQRRAQAVHIGKAHHVFRACATALHRLAVEAREGLDLRPILIDLGHQAGPPRRVDLLAEHLCIAAAGGAVVQATVNGHGRATENQRLRKRQFRAVRRRREIRDDRRVAEQRMKPGEYRDDTLLSPDVEDLLPRLRQEGVARPASPHDRAGIAVHGRDVGCVRAREPVDGVDAATKIRPGETALPVADDDQHCLAFT